MKDVALSAKLIVMFALFPDVKLTKVNMLPLGILDRTKASQMFTQCLSTNILLLIYLQIVVEITNATA